jgi:hypothetical protein
MLLCVQSPVVIFSLFYYLILFVVDLCVQSQLHQHLLRPADGSLQLADQRLAGSAQGAVLFVQSQQRVP